MEMLDREGLGEIFLSQINTTRRLTGEGDLRQEGTQNEPHAFSL